MNFTPKLLIGSLAAILMLGVAVGWMASSGNYPAPAPQAVVAAGYYGAAITPALDVGQAGSSYQPVKSWYKRKSWWKKNAPIVGGAGAGALVGGLVGGGKGAIIGGAAGGGGGYLYKRHKRHHDRDKYYYRNRDRYYYQNRYR
jgi:osmotically inducible lipoprotein OsmB